MRINLSELFTCEGKTAVYTGNISALEVQFGGDVYPIRRADPVELTAVNLGDKEFTVAGTLSVTVEIPCARCLEPVPYTSDLNLSRTFTVGKAEEDSDDSTDEKDYLDGYNLDVDQLVLNELILSLPMRILCREDCKGICNRCGTNLNQGSCTCDTRSLDPRMSVIQDIFKQSKEV